MRLFYLLFFNLFGSPSFSQEYYLFVGTYTTGESKGIYIYRFNTATGQASPVSIAEGVDNPSFLTISRNGQYLYSVNQNRGENPGSVSAFRFEKASGKLTFLNKQLSGGDGPCYVSTDSAGKWVVAGNYGRGNLSVFPVQADGSLHAFTQSITHTGHSINVNRQEKAHVHAVVFSPDNRFILTPDLGLDKVMIYQFDKNAGEKPLLPAKQPFIKTDPGSGPRHITFHPTHPYVYLIEELRGTVSAYSYKKGRLKFIQNISSHPDDYKGEKSSADIHVSPDGKFLYASNRGTANNIAIYSINPENGKLTLQGFQSTMGEIPRNFMIDPTGNYILVANQASSNIVIFKRDRRTGLLQFTGNQIVVPDPVCLKMLEK